MKIYRSALRPYGIFTHNKHAVEDFDSSRIAVSITDCIWQALDLHFTLSAGYGDVKVKSGHSDTHLSHLSPSLGMTPCEYVDKSFVAILGTLRYRSVMTAFIRFDTIPTCDEQTDRRTDRQKCYS